MRGGSFQYCLQPQVELITKTASAMSGIRYVIEGGGAVPGGNGCPGGQTFLVRNLFQYSGKKQILKSDMTEGNYISALMEQLALSHPEISFKYIQNRQVSSTTSGTPQDRPSGHTAGTSQKHYCRWRLKMTL